MGTQTQTSKHEPASLPHRQYLTFRVGDDDYGMDVLRVVEIRGYGGVRSVPRLPGYIRGVLELRGVLVPVVDLRIRFGAGESICSPTTVIIVASARDQEGVLRPLGLVVDTVSDVLDVAPSAVMAPPSFGAAVEAKYLKSMISAENRMVLVLQMDELLARNELAELEALRS